MKNINKDEIIYEVKHIPSKSIIYRFACIMKWILIMPVLFISLVILLLGVIPDAIGKFYTACQIYGIHGVYIAMIDIHFIVILFFLWLAICFFNLLFLIKHNTITLTHKGMYIKSAPIGGLKPWFSYRFYPYGSFTFEIYPKGYGVVDVYTIKVCDDINKEYKILDFKHSCTFNIDNNCEQNMKDITYELVRILREKSKEALIKQGKGDMYNIDEKIRRARIGYWKIS